MSICHQNILRLHSPIPKLTTYSDQDPSFYACHHVTPSVHINSLYDCSNIFSRWLNLICSTKNIEQLTVDYWVVYSQLWNFMEQRVSMKQIFAHFVHLYQPRHVIKWDMLEFIKLQILNYKVSVTSMPLSILWYDFLF